MGDIPAALPLHQAAQGTQPGVQPLHLPSVRPLLGREDRRGSLGTVHDIVDIAHGRDPAAVQQLPDRGGII